MVTPVLEINDLCVVYKTPQGDLPALDHVSVTVHQGEIVGVIGETGSGKSTLVNAILGTLPRHQPGIVDGTVRLDGTDITDGEKSARDARGRKITLVPQNTYSSLNPLFRIGSQIRDLMRCTSPSRKIRPFWRKWRIRDAEILRVLETVRLPAGNRVLRQYPHQLSGGQRQRVMLAMALLPQPQIIIADEPTSSLDAATQVEILKLFRWIAAERNVAVLFTTHNLAAAWEVCDRVIVMHDGRIIEAASRDRLFSHPMHPYTRALLASAVHPLGQVAEIRADFADRPTIEHGCQFSWRCSRALDQCREHRPALATRESEHAVACYNPSTNALSHSYYQA
ncbi:ABC transporter ATP-binding protein [Neorhizobium alkalisoli]|uniref:Peptide/nickel transport system ATP-binding protein n=1 Tax=Neorhizobium alkalisoli TaxID=528178 RepID=A0A561R8Z8_9HYPH|nr:ABC transporter ATP-binding protein [Neorhizobium alkalisoli]TWF59080.1 peptide/nickel transport system ATP-binding protein [Neorhizobium alkalisoli]